ncbi:1,2-phenylacetyl-CoA epoxidase subunit PaaC [Parvicella tangerina]|uniref:1,2-phenylacetyl-CoA epoxidase, subunit C n=1 Tax=Parvicella tangerina TaxID=2829795 RepID=A0A916JJS3_9FLAO|nr:1,2-phenylacetyl-CoA epoxidase subunit PaaC [Parvicella tangerina]CAG5076453.1 1,2-phenylacetyl-CoA epoxidase, subunit C [Parvicella tangerina]
MNDSLYKYTLRLADNGLILSHRLAEYISCAPFLEEDLALTNTGLDLLGQSEALLKYAAEIKGGVDEDWLAFARNEEDYFNFHMVEYPNEDYGYVIARQFLIDVFNYYNYTQLVDSKDERIAAVAKKAIKEVTYHLRRSSEWIIRLGDGTEESKTRIQQCLEDLWMYTDEFFEVDEVQEELHKQGIASDLNVIRKQWNQKVAEVLEEATLTKPEKPKYSLVYGKDGGHTEYMGFLLADMQYLKNRYPEATW